MAGPTKCPVIRLIKTYALIPRRENKRECKSPIELIGRGADSGAPLLRFLRCCGALFRIGYERIETRVSMK